MSKLLEQINKEVEQKEPTDLGDLMLQITSRVNKIQKGNYLENGLVPVYDQGNNDISGYSNDVENAYSGKFPVVIFGDHTLKLRKIMSSFYMGADGNQLIEPIDDNLLDRNYFYYLLLARKPKSYGYERHFKYLKEISIKLPSFLIQKKIAEILSAYDAKIENNNKIIKNLEATAQTIFNEWFVEFEFPSIGGVPVGLGGDLNSEIQPPRLSATPPQEGNKYKSSGGKMVESEMGEIPEGWEVKPLDETAEFLNGVASQKYPAEDVNDSLPVIKIREMNSGVDKNSDRATKNIDSKYVIKNGDILFAWSGSLSLMIWVGGEGVLNQHIFKVTSNIYPKWLIYYWTNKHLQNFKIIAEGKATTMGHIQRHHLTESKVVVPDKLILAKTNIILEPIFKQQVLLQEENISLKSQRDQLLKKLI